MYISACVAVSVLAGKACVDEEVRRGDKGLSMVVLSVLCVCLVKSVLAGDWSSHITRSQT